MPVFYIEKYLEDILVIFFFSWGKVFKREIVHWIFLENINNKCRMQMHAELELKL